MEFMEEAQYHPLPPHDTPPWALPQPPMELSRALYLLHTSKLDRFATQAHHLIHPDIQIRDISPYR